MVLDLPFQFHTPAMDAIASSFHGPLPRLKFSSTPRKPTPYHITFPTITNIRLVRGPEQNRLTISYSLLSSKESVKDKREEGPPPPLDQAVRPSSIPARIFNVLDDMISNVMRRHPLRTSVNPNDVLAGNYAPVGELPPTKCIIDGQLPTCLEGAYIRNGPNPQFMPRVVYHPFDGDGMLHAIHISGGQATFCSRFVRTYKFTKEQEAGLPIYPKFFALEGAGRLATGVVFALRVLTGQINPMNGIGLANTSLTFMNNKLMALEELDLPYVVQLTSDGDIETVGQWDFDGKLKINMTAHPKVDPITNEVFSFQCGPIPPFLNYFRMGVDGKKQQNVPIFSIQQPSFVHDLAITERYAIFPDTQIVLKLLAIFTGVGLPLRYEAKKVARIGIIPRYATDKSEMKWVEVPGFNFVHSLNAWDEKGGVEVVLVAANIMPVEHLVEMRLELLQCCVEMVRINVKEGKVVERKPLSTKNLEFGVINPKVLGRKNRYAFMGMAEKGKFVAIVKLDFHRAGEKDCVVAARSFGERCFVGEPFFVASEEGVDEDDGFVVTFTHDEGSGESRFVVMDAKSPTLDIVASVRLPRRVPYGFHGLFVSQKELQKQKNWK